MRYLERVLRSNEGPVVKMHLHYGRDGLDVEYPSTRVEVIEPTFVPGLADEAAAFTAAVRAPIGGKPLRECVAAHEQVAIVIPDITRPLPTDRLLPWLFAELAHVPARNVVIINGTGSHRITRRTSWAPWWAPRRWRATAW